MLIEHADKLPKVFSKGNRSFSGIVVSPTSEVIYAWTSFIPPTRVAAYRILYRDIYEMQHFLVKFRHSIFVFVRTHSGPLLPAPYGRRFAIFRCEPAAECCGCRISSHVRDKSKWPLHRKQTGNVPRGPSS